MNINNNSTNVKHELLVRIAKLQLDGELTSRAINKIPNQMIPNDKAPIGCCIFHDREILKMRVLARLGWSVEDYDEHKTVEEYAEEALKRESPSWPMLTVLHEACNGCVTTQFLVTNACQGCIARPCMMGFAPLAKAFLTISCFNPSFLRSIWMAVMPFFVPATLKSISPWKSSTP